MVRGRGMAVTAVALMYQCALITRIARGRATDWPKARHAAVYRLSDSAFMGLPCPKNAAGMIGGSSVGPALVSWSLTVASPADVITRPPQPGPCELSRASRGGCSCQSAAQQAGLGMRAGARR